MERLTAELASSLKPSIVDVVLLAQTFERDGNSNKALLVLQEWLLSSPNGILAHIAWYEFGRLLMKCRFNKQAKNAFLAALEQRKDFTEAGLALGFCFEEEGQKDKALQIWESYVPQSNSETGIQLLNNIARVSVELHDNVMAEIALRKSLKLNPNQQSVILTMLNLRQHLCLWPVQKPDLNILNGHPAKFFGPLSSLAQFGDPKMNLESARSFLSLMGWDKEFLGEMKGGERYAGHEKIRVGFLSADYKLHATTHFFGPILRGLKRDLFEVYALDITVAKDVGVVVGAGLIQSTDFHIPLQHLDDQQAVSLIKLHEIDVLVDMAGLTLGARPEIISRRAAPIQISYLGFIGSTGIANMDFIVTTKDLMPKESRVGYSEAPLYLPGAYLSFGERNSLAQAKIITREDCKLPSQAIVFCALCNSYKITPEIYECWLRILSRVKDGVLWLIADNKIVQNNLLSFAIDRGIDPSRLVFTHRVAPNQYSEFLKLADVFLDTSPYGSGATAREAILANLPIITYPGGSMMSRLAAHLMSQLNMREFIVANLRDYENFAVKLASSKKLILKYKKRMLESYEKSTLFRIDEFVDQFSKMLVDVQLKSANIEMKGVGKVSYQQIHH